jgi:DNA-binding NtrC family response regulator
MDTQMATIVVIDDDMAIRSVVSRILKLDQHRVLAFEDGEPALERMNFDEVDLLITDLRMPTPGEEVISTLRDRGVKVRTIVMSGYVNDTQARNLESLGVKDIVEKPFKVPELLDLVRNCISPN